MRIWLALSLALLLVPFSSVSPFRWLLMLLYPLTFYAAHSLSQLKVKQTWKWLRFPPVKIAVVYLILVLSLPSIGFITFSSENPFPYFNPQRANPYQYQIPTSMLQNTIAVTDYQDTANAISWFKNNTNSKAILLTHTVFYGWGLLALDSERVLTYGFDDPQVAAESAFQNNSQIYLIWWVNGQGWYNQSSLPLSFHEAYHSGDIAIYQYI